MPTYEYRCANGHDFEEFVLRISAAKSELPCPSCGARGERRLSAGGGLLFKGSGFYITDYGKDGKKPAAAGKTGDATADAKSDAKRDPKSAGGEPGAGAPKSDAPKGEAKPASAPVSPTKGGE